jgi:Xaa-Pro dipeptidase
MVGLYMDEKKFKNIIDNMHQKGFDAMLIKDVNNIGYLSNYFPTGNDFCLLKEDPIIFTSKMDLENSELNSTIEVKPIKSLNEIKEVFEKERYGKIAIEKTLDIETYQKLSGSYQLVIDDLLEKERMIKTSEEIAKIEKAVKIAHNSYIQLKSDIEDKKLSEIELSYKLGQLLRKKGAQYESFETIFASGSNTSLPHSTPRNKKIESPILVDWGAKYNGYCSDTTRTTISNEKEEEIFNIVLEAYNKTIKAIKPGIKCCELDTIARDIIAEYGYGENFIHSTGHGLGLDIHEPPSLSVKDKTKIERGMVITVEPGIYIKNEFGVRIEDTVHVTSNGKVIGNLSK